MAFHAREVVGITINASLLAKGFVPLWETVTNGFLKQSSSSQLALSFFFFPFLCSVTIFFRQ